MEYLTSSEVKGVPSCQVTPVSKWSVTCLPSGATSQDRARLWNQLVICREFHQRVEELTAGAIGQSGGRGEDRQSGRVVVEGDDQSATLGRLRPRSVRQAWEQSCGTHGGAAREHMTAAEGGRDLRSLRFVFAFHD